ncbi:hypothetical protein SERLADRAFT_363576 [Serpula lacrymans var. lacrymans S7.9]|uniref:DNA-directed RNA polymerase n=1 Tax=Serpula lacrymans var. lacrymans (strain S7.9) TaxID=578457 RepID=F8P940_SERL9|nr:uncharacterized protein SERLADRAFT_363576 [Serpula lacrymans var. lacrymans S7.9]EGO20169.1 hypothetical protein SERLADRAFT_363576 [Serpula lacrymans var. lacrymans S7.9]
MEHESEKIQPTTATYSLMLLAWLRFNPDSETPVNLTIAHNPTKLLTSIIDRQISVSHIVSDRVFTSSEEASQVIKLLSRAAVDLNLSRVVSELGQIEAMATQSPDPLESVPEVTPVMRWKEAVDEDGTVIPSASQEEMPFNLSNLRKHLTQVQLARRVLSEDVAARQKLLEESVYDVAVARLKHEADLFDELGLNNKGLKRADLQRWMWDWHQKLQPRLDAEIQEIIVAEEKAGCSTGAEYCVIDSRGKGTNLGPFLQLVKPSKLSLITILEIMRLNGSGGVSDGMKTARALLTVGRAVENEYKAQMCKRNNIAIPSQSRPGEYGFFTGFGYRDLHARRVTAAKYTMDSEEWTTEWTQLLRVRVGSILVDCLMDVATVTRTAIDKRTQETISEDQPAFYHAYEYVRGQKLGVIRLNPVVADRIAKDGLRETLHPRHLPMLVKPKPWLNYDQGGYLYNKSSAMRFKDSQEQQSYLQHASELGNVELVYAGLDVLGSTPWKINRNVFDVVLTVWNSGERLCKLPPSVFDQPEPEKPDNLSMDIKAKSVYGQRLKAYMQAKANNHSDRCSVNYKIEIARAFLGDTMYLPHNLDFRGRAYPIPPHLNHIGDDLSRGLLMFGEAKPLGERGLRWLKIHLANLYGFDKANFDERVEYVMERLDEVYDSAEKPLEGRRWWTKADDPWQCLATCMELRAALESEDPEAYMSSLPVHQDGTCNGLQHYAALGGDNRGAQQVNLSVTERPSDVYTYVANMVQRQLDEDAANDHKYAKMLQGKVARKVVKQTVMTTVYGVTYIGARDQIERQLKDRKDIPEEECWNAAAYLAKKTLFCIGDLFSGAKAIQTWLNLCARLVAKSIPAERIPEALEAEKTKRRLPVSTNRIRKEQMTSVVWTTPLGLPIVQPYRKVKRKQIMTALQTVYISDPNAPAEVNANKQASAFPPNFIHSLDATHMMLTALECRTQGVTFASVHDSYWTHASSIDQMSEIIRDTFIALHSSDVLGKLYSEFKERYRTHKIPLASLRTGKMMKHLQQVGVSLAREQATGLGDTGLGSLVKVVDKEQIDTGSAKAGPAKRGRKKKSIMEEETVLAEDEDEEDEEEVIDPALQDKFVDLCDVLPPVPKKGDFNVETIKRSQYFFS